MKVTDTKLGGNWTLREWKCCRLTWQLIITPRYPQRNRWQPTCPKCGGSMVTGAKKKGDSKRMREKQRLEHEHGTLQADGLDWSDLDDDLLLDLWLQGRGIKTIAKIMDRPMETIKNRGWKLATGYRK